MLSTDQVETGDTPGIRRTRGGSNAKPLTLHEAFAALQAAARQLAAESLPGTAAPSPVSLDR